MQKDLSLKEHQKIMLNILFDFATFCDKHNLRYFLDAGTLLGAVRHHGFIPWDNDADVCMPRPDFNKFYKLLEINNFYLNDHIILERPEDTIHAFCKLGNIRTRIVEYPDTCPEESHIYIDIFVKDGLPNEYNKAKRVCKKSERLGLWHWFYKHSMKKWPKENNIFKKILVFFFKPFVKNANKAYLKQKKFIEKINKKYPYESCEFVTTLSNGEYYRRCKKSNFDDFILMDFENKQFKVPVGYDDWLTVLYGKDYMTIPPKEKQQIHNVIVQIDE